VTIPARKPDERLTILLAALAALAAWMLPMVRWAVWPIILLNTYIHEYCHAASALLTGGEVFRIQIHATGGGATLTAGGWQAAISSAGYVGASVVGGLLIASARTERTARACLFTLAIALALGIVLWVRGDLIGMLAGIGIVLILMFASRSLSKQGIVFAAAFVGISQCLASVEAFLVLLRVAGHSNIQNDAANMQASTGLPAAAWAAAWLVVSLVSIWLGWKTAWNSKKVIGRG
jgi:hypothetical protein